MSSLAIDELQEQYMEQDNVLSSAALHIVMPRHMSEKWIYSPDFTAELNDVVRISGKLNVSF